MIRNGLKFLTLVCLLSLPAFAHAQESLGEFVAKLNTTPAKDGKPETHKLDYHGTYPDVPEGTCINVRFRLQGNQQFISVYRAYTDSSGKFAGASGEFTKTMLPGVYEAEFLFAMGPQKSEVRKWFRLNMGWARSHTEILKVETLTIGDVGSSKQVEQKLYSDMESFRSRAEKAYRVLEERINAATKPDAAWAETGRAELKKALLAIQREFYLWQGNYVALPAGKIRNRLFGTINSLFTVLKDYSNNVNAAIMKQHVKNISTSFSELKTSLELDPIEVPDPQKKG